MVSKTTMSFDRQWKPLPGTCCPQQPRNPINIAIPCPVAQEQPFFGNYVYPQQCGPCGRGKHDKDESSQSDHSRSEHICDDCGKSHSSSHHSKKDEEKLEVEIDVKIEEGDKKKKHKKPCGGCRQPCCICPKAVPCARVRCGNISAALWNHIAPNVYGDLTIPFSNLNSATVAVGGALSGVVSTALPALANFAISSYSYTGAGSAQNPIAGDKLTLNLAYDIDYRLLNTGTVPINSPIIIRDTLLGDFVIQGSFIEPNQHKTIHRLQIGTAISLTAITALTINGVTPAITTFYVLSTVAAQIAAASVGGGSIAGASASDVANLAAYQAFSAYLISAAGTSGKNITSFTVAFIQYDYNKFVYTQPVENIVKFVTVGSAAFPVTVVSGVSAVGGNSEALFVSSQAAFVIPAGSSTVAVNTNIIILPVPQPFPVPPYYGYNPCNPCDRRPINPCNPCDRR